jgi:cytochrome c-type biogenesis protein CcmH
MGWLVLLLLVAFALAALRLMGVRGAMIQAAGAALLFGSAGYAFQGHPELRGTPAAAAPGRDFVSLAAARHAFFGNFTPEESWLSLSDALASSGDSEGAVGILKNAVGRYPKNPQLWIGLGNALVDHAHGLTPPAELAYRRAAELAPGQPAAPFFRGLALAHSGDREAAVAIWRNILVKAPPNASWRPLVEQGVATLGEPDAAPVRQ